MNKKTNRYHEIAENYEEFKDKDLDVAIEEIKSRAVSRDGNSKTAAVRNFEKFDYFRFCQNLENDGNSETFGDENA